MAYIEWWNRTGPITLGERFGLNEISIARNTLSPTKSYTEDRAGLKFGGSWADWKSNHEDQMTFEEYLKMDFDKPVHPINKNAGGVVETGNIARRPGAVPPLSGPTPQGRGIVGLFSSPKRVNIT